MLDRRIAIIAVVVFSALLIGSLAIASQLYPREKTSSALNSTITSSTSSSQFEYSYSSNISSIYTELGYPKLNYNGPSTYSPNKPNFTVDLGTETGYVLSASVMSLETAVDFGLSGADLSSSNYSLAAAEFDPGIFRSNALWYPATWILWFAQDYDSFWLYGEGSVESSSYYIVVNAINGTVMKSISLATYQPLPGQYSLNVTASQALAVVRGQGILQSFPPALTQEGSVTSINPRIIKFDPGANLPLQHPLNVALDGQSRLCWVISMTSQSAGDGAGWQGAFAVDAESGKLVSGWDQGLFPSGGFGIVSASLIPSTAKNIMVSNETFEMKVNATGLPASVSVLVPNVFVLRPGSTSSITMNITSYVGNDVIASLSISDHFPVVQNSSLPPGLEARFSNRTVSLGGYSDAMRTVYFTVDSNAPPATYSIALDGIPIDNTVPYINGPSFFLTIWNGTGQWPSPLTG